MRSRLSLILGLLLAVGAFVALLVVGQILNPSPYQVVVVIEDVAPGTPLSQDLVAVDAQSVDPKVAGEYVLKDELGEWMGAAIVEPLHPGQPLMHAHLVRADNPAVERRLALGIEDEGLVAMVVPVDAQSAPQNIQPGDRVDVVYGVGNVRPQTEGVGELLGEQMMPGAEAEAPGATPGLTPTPTPRMTFPVAKVAVRNLRVLDTVHEEQPNPAYGGPESGQPATIEGELQAVQVAVPREQEEILHYCVTTGKYQVALLSPNAPSDDEATLGMTWDDLVAFFWAERGRALESITGTARLLGPGAAAVVKTPATTPFPTAVVSPTGVITGAEALTATMTPEGAGVEATPTAAEVAALPGEEETPAAPRADSEAGEGEAGGGEAEAGEGSPLPGGLVTPSLLKGVVCAGAGAIVLAILVLAVVRFLGRRESVQE